MDAFPLYLVLSLLKTDTPKEITVIPSTDSLYLSHPEYPQERGDPRPKHREVFPTSFAILRQSLRTPLGTMLLFFLSHYINSS